MKRRLLLASVIVSASMACLSTLPAAASAVPSGERLVGGTAAGGGTVVEPVYDDMTGQIQYVSTPRGAPDPVNTNPRATAPFYLVEYPASSTIVTNGVTLNCQDVPAENCPDHGPALAGLAQLLEPAVYPGVLPGAALGHDHLLGTPGSGGDFNVAWVPTLVLFTNPAAADTHITTLTQLNAMIAGKDVITVPLNGTPFDGIPLPNKTFHCSVVSAAVYAHGVPFTG